jgi:hypothetical protein
MLYAPITRTYTETYAEPADVERTVPYERNNIKIPVGMSECLGYLDLWKRDFDGDCFCYEYHFMTGQMRDVSNLYASKILHEDIVSLKNHGLNGIIEDGSQRSYFPTGLQFYVYGETLFDRNVTFEELRDDYFSHAFGERWREVLSYLEALRDSMSYNYFCGNESKDESIGKFYNPDLKASFTAARRIIKDFLPTIKENLYQEQRASAVAWQLLELHSYAASKRAEMAEYLCVNDTVNADKVIAETILEMSKREVYFERWYDHFFYVHDLKYYGTDKNLIDNMNV